MVQTKTDYRGFIQWKNAELITLETTLELSQIGIAIAVHDGEYCSVISEN